MEMIASGKFPKNTLFCGDAGFVGYPLWSAIVQRGAHFLIRVGANVSLLAESADYQLHENGLVLCWPKAMQSEQRPLRLRLVKVRIGKAQVYLLTSVQDPVKLPIKQMLKLYKLRWGIEVEFRGLKQTLDRGKLRCRNDQRLLAELNWSIMAMAVVELFALKEQLAQQADRSRNQKQAADPAKRSLANAMRAIRGCMRDRDGIPEPGRDLATLLGEAVTDSYDRKKPKAALSSTQSRQEAHRGTESTQTNGAGEEATAQNRDENGRLKSFTALPEGAKTNQPRATPWVKQRIPGGPEGQRREGF